MLLPASHVGHAMDMCCITAQCLRKSAADRALLGPTWVTQHTCTVSSGGRPDLRHDLCCSVARVSHHFFTHASYTSSLQAQTEQERLRSEHYKEMADACLAGNWAMQLQPQGPRQGSPVPEPSSGAVAKASSKRSRSRSQKKPHDRRSSKHRDGRERSRSRHRLNYQDRSSSKYGDRRERSRSRHQQRSQDRCSSKHGDRTGRSRSRHRQKSQDRCNSKHGDSRGRSRHQMRRHVAETHSSRYGRSRNRRHSHKA